MRYGQISVSAQAGGVACYRDASHQRRFYDYAPVADLRAPLWLVARGCRVASALGMCFDDESGW